MSSPAARFKPALDVIEAIGAPERLTIDHDVGRAENAASDRGIDFAPQSVFHCRIVERTRERIGLDAKGPCDFDCYFGLRNIPVLGKIRAIQSAGEPLCERGIPVSEPIERPARCGARDGKSARDPERQSEEASAPFEIALCI